MGRAAIYARISKDREGLARGVKRQQADCQQLATDRGHEVVAMFEDNDISASKYTRKKRPGFTAMLKQARDGGFDVILAYSNSRLARNGRDFQTLIELAEDYGVRYETVKSGSHDLTTADGRALLRTVAAWDIAEAERTAERVKAAHDERAKEGRWHGGTAPYGYLVKDGTLVPNPPEVEVIQDAITRILQGDTTYSIVRVYGEMGRTTRSGAHWQQSNLRRLLTNRSLLGETKTGAKGWEPIIDEATFERLGRIFSDPARKVVNQPATKGGMHSLTGGLAVCGVCGGTLVASPNHGELSLMCRYVSTGPKKDKHPTVERVYRIKGQEVTRKVSTGRVSIPYDLVEWYVFESVIASLKKNERFTERMAPGDDADKLRDLDAEREKLQSQLDRLLDLASDGVFTKAEVSTRVQSLRAQIKDVGRRVDDMLGSTVVTPDTVAALRDWNSEDKKKRWSPTRRRAFLRRLVTKVEIMPNPTPGRTSVRQRKGESAADFEAREAEFNQTMIEARVKIHLR